MVRNGARRVLLVALCLAGLANLAASCGPRKGRELGVVATTSHLGSIVERVAKDKVNLTVITAANRCPGEEDVKPSQVEATAEARLFLMHGWPGEAFTTGLLQSVNNPQLRVETIDLKGSWMTPEVQAQGVERVAKALAEVDPANKAFYQANAEALLKSVRSKGEELKARLEAEKTSEVKAIAMAHQADFVKWAGLEVIASYPPPAELTPEKVKALVDKGKEAKVALVIDNLQSGPEAGKQIAQEIEAVHVTLSNFPGGFEGTETWEKAAEKNVELLLQALKKYRGK